jgi:hypothetical protein
MFNIVQMLQLIFENLVPFPRCIPEKWNSIILFMSFTLIFYTHSCIYMKLIFIKSFPALLPQMNMLPYHKKGSAACRGSEKYYF